MAEQKKERKRNLLTVRLTDEDANTLEYLEEHLGSSRTDTLIRACRFFLNVGDSYIDGEEKDKYGRGKERKNRQIHVRVTDSDMALIDARREQFGESVSQIFRKAIKTYDNFKKSYY
jgi:uncharacterized protein (DUF1778 family)